ncbi:MAG TPA: AI-2E family transporter, partial [Pararhizobium sp.]|nr:AI-2E family transporter [Pararhizobium sp.]
MPDIRPPLAPQSLRRPRIPPANRPGTPGSAIIVGIAVVAALYLGREVLVPITLALLLAFVLSPLVHVLRKLRLGRIPSVLVAVLLALGIILALATAIGSQVAQLAEGIPVYEATIEKKIANLRENTVDRIANQIGSLGHRLVGDGAKAGKKEPSSSGPGDTETDDTGKTEPKPVPVVVTEPTPSALQIGKEIVFPLLHPLATAGIIFVVTIFALLQKEDLRNRAIRLFGSSDLEGSTAAIDDAGRRLSRYFLTQLGINTSFGVIVTVGLYFIGVPSPVLWGILGALLRFIPYIGSYIAAALPIVLAAAVEPGWTMAIWTAILYVVVEVTVGQAVEPMVYGSSTGISPLAVVVAAIFWTWIWGAIGLLISTPLTLCLVVLGRHIERLEFLDVLLGDRPALSPPESFYQRMLASDPDGAEEQAERYLKELPLSAYY